MALQSECSDLFKSLTLDDSVNDSNEIKNKESVNKDIFNAQQLELYNNCKLIDFQEKICQNLNNLVKLNLSNNSICDLPQSICSLEKLEHFILDKNNIQYPSNVLNDLKCLNELNLSGNNLTEFPFNIEKFKKLQVLNLSNNKLNHLPNSWAKMNNLRVLDLSKNLFKKTPSCLQEGMSRIEVLDFSDNRNMNINVPIFSNNLKQFYAKNNGEVATRFPKWIFSGKFTEMEELDFENTQFLTVYIPICDRKLRLKKLNLKQCKLYDNLVKQIFINISSLEYLNIGNTQNTCFANSFSIIPDEFFPNTQALMRLDINNVGLADVSKNIETYINLTEMYLQKNLMTWLPDEICTLKKLQVLDISENNLIMLPQNLGSMTSLKILNASHNNISTLPSTTIYLKNLEFLDLFSNNITEMPVEIKFLENLVGVDLEFNLFSTDDIVMSKSYTDLREQLRIDKSYRFIGPNIINVDSTSIDSSNNSKSDDSYISSDTESINENSNNIVEGASENEIWSISIDSSDEFDPFNPPPIVHPNWETPQTFFMDVFNFCPADLHPQKIKDIITQSRVNGQCKSPLPIVEGQFDDAD